MRKNSHIIGKSMVWTDREPVDGIFDVNDIYNHRLTNNWPTTGKYLSHSLSPGTTVQEGSSLIMTVTTEGFEDGELLYYTINTVSGATMTGADFNDGNISGSFAVTNNSGALTKELVQSDTEEFNVMNIDIRFGSVSGPIQDTTSDITITDIEDVIGQTLYTSYGSNSWTCPANVTSVHVCCCGGGGGGSAYTSSYDAMGGGGGGLGWRNNITVVPGVNYTAYVGNGGNGGQRYYNNYQHNYGTDGQNSYFIDTGTVYGGGGQRGDNNTAYGGGYSGTSTDKGGGNGGNSYEYGNGPAGGGGAGGYTGSGGRGRQYNSYPESGAGGGGGGGGEFYSNYQQYAGYGGGVGYFGQSNNGAAGSSSNDQGQPGSIQNIGSSGQGHGGSWQSWGKGGRAVTVPYSYGGSGYRGFVRIIWGNDRAWPTTQTWDIT
tara:strand:+ start:424 stop:1713 length:1290 start_codon:yes stop_codon:yes gene_type:complete